MSGPKRLKKPAKEKPSAPKIQHQNEMNVMLVFLCLHEDGADCVSSEVEHWRDKTQN
jgi:hypothetical protein